MTVIHQTTKFDAPIERVFELITDYKRYPEWNVNYVEVLAVEGLPQAPGTRIHAVMKFLDRKLDGWAEVKDVEAPTFIRLSGTSKEGGHLTVSYRLRPIDAATEVEMELDYELPTAPFAKILDRLFLERAVERDVRHSLENFKAFIEARMPVLA
ncbi:MAG TPA: SRPBCC family protein [Patescibacteria group bacterium]|jgi:uncharacterized membrane protein|nr:SRPBCC family protein [Patescibacteria group bacterium]